MMLVLFQLTFTVVFVRPVIAVLHPVTHPRLGHTLPAVIATELSIHTRDGLTHEHLLGVAAGQPPSVVAGTVWLHVHTFPCVVCG